MSLGGSEEVEATGFRERQLNAVAVLMHETKVELRVDVSFLRLPSSDERKENTDINSERGDLIRFECRKQIKSTKSTKNRTARRSHSAAEGRPAAETARPCMRSSPSAY